MREDFNPDVVQNREFNGRSIEDKLDGFFTAESKEGNPFFEHFLYQNDEISDQDSVNLLGVNDDQDFWQGMDNKWKMERVFRISFVMSRPK